ncbi:Abi family protein [Sporomusa termitida]|uniref:Abi-like protein n=1 Tax=Sporomusa termitida TaxID=2377 RepID=A0A517DSE8_9FIRM|nr:Abi family protein [Sporomusa termitida]QDR80247.1 Abi-like protein [Sporomusa termitida]
MNPLKPPCTFKEQIEILKSRNLIIIDENYAEMILSRVNYYRLSAYGLGLHENNQYKENITFEIIYRLYEFDVRFRYLFLEVIEIIEVMFRTKIAYQMANKYGSECYLNDSLFQVKKYHDKFIEEFALEKYHQRNAAFVKHHEDKYGGKMPIWVAVELFSFGMLSRFYGNMKVDDQWKVAEHFKTSPVFIRSWLKCLVEVRNICAHYGRIYNRILSSEPRLYNEHKYIKKDRAFAVIIVIKRLLNDDSFRKSFVLNLNTLIEEFEDTIDLSYIGFPTEWGKMLGEYIESK